MITAKAPPGHMLTYTGKFVDPLNATPDDIDIIDIAHHLSNLCRYNGAVDFFFSVAQHSVLVAQRFRHNSYLRKWAILHDASEAYLGDIISPLKYLEQFEFYLEAEERLMNVICDKFDLDYEMPEEVKRVDIKMRGAEMRDLKNYFPEESNKTYLFAIKPWLPIYAKTQFLLEAQELGIFEESFLPEVSPEYYREAL
jgi:uncharacterized protein